MTIKYFDNFTGTWNDISGSTGSTLVYGSDGEWTTSAGYKKWVGNLTQTGTSDPTVTVYENTFGSAFTSTYVDVGKYYLTKDAAFTSGKTVIFINNNVVDYLISAQRNSASTIQINVIESDTLTRSDDVLNNTSIEIRVYN